MKKPCALIVSVVLTAVFGLAACGSSENAGYSSASGITSGSTAGASGTGSSASGGDGAADVSGNSDTDTSDINKDGSLSSSAATDAGSQDSGESGVMMNTDYSMEEITIDRDEYHIYGRLYRPEADSEVPLVILSHGFGGSYRDVDEYARMAAEHGIAAFDYDFVGGGSGSRSGGSTTEMSVLTEASDLNAVLDYFEQDSGIRQGHIYLLGASQGGFVSTYVAGNRPDDVAGLILFYPAFVLQDDSKERNPDPENGPDESSLMGVRIGRIYDEDAQSFDIYDVMKNYTGKVLIVHGTDDSIVPVSYSERAARTFPDARLITIAGADHGFYGQNAEDAANDALAFIVELESR